VRRHVLLKVEVGKLLILLQLKKSTKLGIRVNLTTILLILKTVSPDVSVNLASHLSTSPLGSNRLAQKVSQLLGNQSRLDEARRSTVSRLALTLGDLLGGTHLARNMALQDTEVTAKSRQTRTQSLKLGAKVTKQRRKR
jgi:hypothetical protein